MNSHSMKATTISNKTVTGNVPSIIEGTKTSVVSIRELTELSVICALMFGIKEAMNILPNIHPVALIIILATMIYGWKAMYPVVGFCLLEIGVFGLGPWSLMYLYIWPLLVVIAMLFRENRNWLVWALIAGVYGLMFGALCTIPYIFTSGIQAAIAYWIAGIPFDLIHGASNFVIVLVLLPILYKTVCRVKGLN